MALSPLPRAAQLHKHYANINCIDRDSWYTEPRWSPIHARCDAYRERVAREFLERPSEPHSPLVRAAYAAFEAELYAQFEFLIESGVKFNFTWDDPVDPATGKPSYKYTRTVVEQTGVLPVFRTKRGDNPLTAPAHREGNYVHGGNVLYANDLFRAVHDYLGHLASGGNFGERGEKIAYLSHYQLFGPLARRALYTETVAQNAVFNHTREFAPQKTLLFPVDYHAVPL